MKKGLSVIVTVLLAFVMGFALFACGSPDDDSNEIKQKDKAAALQTALSSLGEYWGAATQEGRLTYKCDTANTDSDYNSIDFVKSGAKFFYKHGNDGAKTENMLDMSTGLLYVNAQNGWMYDKTLYPQGTVEYVAAVLSEAGKNAPNGGTQAVEPKISLDDIVYNAKAGTFTVSFDYAENVNKALYPIQEVYESGGSVIDLLDEYIAAYYDEIIAAVPQLKTLIKPPLTVYKINELLKAALMFAKDKPLIEFIGGMSDITVAEYEAFLLKFGLTGEALADAKARTVGEAIEGALAYVNAKIDLQAIAGGDLGSIEAFVKTFISGTDEQKAQAVAEMFGYVFVREVDVTNFDRDIATLFNTVYDLLDAIEVKQIIDKLDGISLPGMSTQIAAAVGMGAEIVKEVIVSRAAFTALGGSVVLKLNADYSAREVDVKLEASHDYDGETVLPVLSDNDFSAEFAFIPTGASNEVKPDITLVKYDGATEVSRPVLAAAVMRLDEEKDVSVYLETRMFDNVQASVVSVSVVDENDERTTVDGAVVRYDGAKSSFVFDSRAVKTAIADKKAQGVRVKKVSADVTVTFGEGDDSYGIPVELYLADGVSVQSAGALIGDVIEGLRPSGGGNIPSLPQD